MIGDDFWVIVAIGAILYGCFGKKFYYASSVIPGRKNMPMPIWLGRTVAIGIGLLTLFGLFFGTSATSK